MSLRSIGGLSWDGLSTANISMRKHGNLPAVYLNRCWKEPKSMRGKNPQPNETNIELFWAERQKMQGQGGLVRRDRQTGSHLQRRPLEKIHFHKKRKFTSIWPLTERMVHLQASWQDKPTQCSRGCGTSLWVSLSGAFNMKLMHYSRGTWIWQLVECCIRWGPERITLLS